MALSIASATIAGDEAPGPRSGLPPPAGPT